MAFAGVPAGHVAIRRNEHQRRPGANGIGVPDGKVGVVDDGMPDVVAHDGLLNAVRFLFGLELARMHANHHQFVGIFGFKGFQVGNDVQAVDAAVGPEVEQDDFPAQLGERQRARNVEPGHAAFQFGRADRAHLQGRTRQGR